MECFTLKKNSSSSERHIGTKQIIGKDSVSYLAHLVLSRVGYILVIGERAAAAFVSERRSLKVE